MIRRLVASLVLGVACAASADAARDDSGAPHGTVPPAAAASTAARGILDRARPAMIQIKGFFGTNTAEAFHGSGFAVARGGVSSPTGTW